MRFRVAAERQVLVFEYQDDAGDAWCVESYHFHSDGQAAIAEAKSVSVLNCIGRAATRDGKLNWDVSRDDLSAGNVIAICRHVAFGPARMTGYQVLAKVIQQIPRVLSYNRERAIQVGKEVRRSFAGNLTRGQL